MSEDGRSTVAPPVVAAAESGPAEEGILEAEAGQEGKSYGRGAGILSVGIATTGVVTFAYFAVASHVLPEVEYKGISLLWSVMFVVISIIYRPIEQLLSRTIAERRAQGHEQHPYRVPVTIQASFAVLFAAVALALKGPLINDVFDGSSELYWVLVVGTLAYAASYFARGWLAGHERFALYGGLVFLESTSRFLFALAVAVGITSGQGAVALGIAAAPFVSLVVVPWAFSRRKRRARPRQRPAAASRETRESPCRTAWASRSACSGSCWPSRPCSTQRSSPPTSPPPTPRWPASCSTCC